MFLPDCGCCGRCGCQCGVLPHTITAKFSGFAEQQTTSWLTASASACFGSGAFAAIKAPGGKGNNGPIQTVAIRDPGKCYAERDRVLPVLRASGAGTGAVLEVTVAPDAADDCGRPRWKITNITTTGGTGYANNSLVTVLPSAGRSSHVRDAAIRGAVLPPGDRRPRRTDLDRDCRWRGSAVCQR